MPAPVTVQNYTPTSIRQPLTFEPIRPGTSSTAPSIVFAPPRSFDAQQTEPATATVKPVGTPRLIENIPAAPAAPVVAMSPQRTAHSAQPVAPPQPAAPETAEQFIRAQWQLAESGNPDSVFRAYSQLSKLYEKDQLSESERAVLLPLLDALAINVIYARASHILEPPYSVKPGDTIETIAQEYKLTPSLLRKINGLAPFQELPPGTMLKVLGGQFDARISIKRKELTLLLGGLYAGRFPFMLSSPGVSTPSGEYFVTQKDSRTIALDNGWVLSTAFGRNVTLIFGDTGAQEIFDILSEQSVIVVVE
jgi:LysM repeat protein